jgi:hypothetical protein
MGEEVVTTETTMEWSPIGGILGAWIAPGEMGEVWNGEAIHVQDYPQVAVGEHFRALCGAVVRWILQRRHIEIHELLN